MYVLLSTTGFTKNVIRILVAASQEYVKSSTGHTHEYLFKT